MHALENLKELSNYHFQYVILGELQYSKSMNKTRKSQHSKP